MPVSWFQNLQNNITIDKQLSHNFARLLYSKVNRSCFGHPLGDLSQDRQLSGLHPSSCSNLASDHTRDVHNKIHSLNPSPYLYMYTYIQNQPRMAYEAVYRREPAARYQPESWARRAARRLISGCPRAAIHGRVRHPRLVVYLLYLRPSKSIYL